MAVGLAGVARERAVAAAGRAGGGGDLPVACCRRSRASSCSTTTPIRHFLTMRMSTLRRCRRAPRRCGCGPRIRKRAAAARALFGFPFADMVGAHGKWLVDRKAALKRQYPGAAYFNAHPRPARHRDVDGQPHRDGRLPGSRALQVGVLRRLLHVSVRQQRARARNPDQAASTCRMQTKLLQRFRSRLGLASPLPATFAGISGVRHAHARGEPAPRRRRRRSSRSPTSGRCRSAIRRAKRSSRSTGSTARAACRRATSTGVPGLHLPPRHHRCVAAEAARAHPHVGRRRRLLQPARRQRAEPRARWCAIRSIGRRPSC